MLKTLNLSLLAIMATAIILVPLSISSFQQQQAYAPRDCPSCGEFKKLTHELEKNVIGLVGNPNEGPIPHLRELVDAYGLDVNRIFLGGPDTLPELLATYQLAVLAVFQIPPDPEKQQQHDQIKDFRSLTHDFVKAVIGAVNPPEPD